MTTQVTPVEGLDKGGLNLDQPSIQLPPNVFSNGRNIRFDDGAIRKFLGHIEILTGHGLTNIQAIKYWQSPIGAIYVLINNNRINLLRLRSDGTPDVRTLSNVFSSGGEWQATLFNGGYSIIINNGIDTPVHITANQDTAYNDLMAQNLPNWAGYMVESTEVTSVSAGIIISAGAFLMAGDLVEQDADGNTLRELRGVVRSSDVAVPGAIPQNWNPFMTGANTADELLLADTGNISALVSLQGKVFAFTAGSIHQIEVTASGLRTIPITEQYGALSSGSVFEFDGRLLVVGSNDIYEFSGHPSSIQSISDGRVRRYFYNNLNPIHSDISIQRNLAYDEIWIAYANLASTTGRANEALVFNYRDGTWTIRDLPDVSSIANGAIPGGGISGTTITLGGTGNTGEFGLVDAGTEEVQTLTVTGTAQARHTGIRSRQSLAFTAPPTPVMAVDREVFDLVISNVGAQTAQPNLEFATHTITFPEFTPHSNSGLAGGTRLVLTGTNPESATIDATGLTFTNAGTYVSEVARVINADSVAGLETYTATVNGLVITLTSDVQGPRAITSATLTTHTGNPTVNIGGATGTTAVDGLTVTASSNAASATYAAFSGGSGTGNITATRSNGSTDFGGALGTPTSRGAPPYTINGGDSVIEVAATHPSGASDEPVSATFRVTRGGAVVGGPFSINNGGSGPVSGFLRGPAYQSGDESTFQSQNRVSTTLWQAGDVVEVTAQQGNVRIVTSRRAQRQLYNYSYTNNNLYIVTLNSSTTGVSTSLTVNPGATVAAPGTNNVASSATVASNGGPQNILGANGARITNGSSTTTGGIVATVTSGGSDFGGALGAHTERAAINNAANTRGTASQFTLNYTVNAADRVITAVGVGIRPGSGDDPAEQVGALSITGYNPNNASITRAWARGPAYQPGDENSVSAGTRGSDSGQSYTAGQVVTATTGTSQTGRYTLGWSSSRGAARSLNNINFRNSNSYPVTLSSLAFPDFFDGRTINAGSTLSAMGVVSDDYQIAFNSQTIQQGTVTWTAANARTAGLQEDAFNVIVMAGGATITIGDVPRGESRSATSAGGQTAITGTWTGQVFGTNTVAINQNTSNSASTTIGSVTIDRTTQTRIAANTGSGTTTATDGQITVTRSPASPSEVFVASGTAMNYRATRMQGNNPTEWVSEDSFGVGMHANQTVMLNSWVLDSVIDNGNGGSAGLTGRINGSDGTWAPWGGPGQFADFNYRNTTNIQYLRGGPSNEIVMLPVVVENIDRVQTARASSEGDTRPGPNFTLNMTRGDLEDRFDYTLRNNNTQYEITSLTSNLGGVTASGNLAAGGTRTASNRASGNWSFSHGATLRYDYAARVAANQGPAIITHANGDISDVTLTTSNQALTSNVSPAIINVQGSYTTITGTADTETAPTLATTQVGNGVFGIANADAPTVGVTIAHSGTNAFTVDVPAFEADDDTTAEYQEFLLATLPSITEFSGLDPRVSPAPTQPTGAVFYVEASPDNTNAVRFVNVDAGDITPVTITGHATFSGVRYDETTFGGNIMEAITPIIEGATGDPAPIIEFQHSSGNVQGIYFGTHSTADEVATTSAAVLNSAPNWDATAIGATVTAIRTQSVEGDAELIVPVHHTPETDHPIPLPTASLLRTGLGPRFGEPTLLVTNPDGTGNYTVDLDGLGTENGTITSEQIAGAIRDQFATESFGAVWTVGGSGAMVTFTSNTDPTLPVMNGQNTPATLVANTTPGYTGQILGREIADLWSYSISDLGDTGTTATQLPAEEWVETTAGVDPTYSRDGSLVVQLGTGQVLVPLSDLTIDEAGQAIFDTFNPDNRFVATYDVAADVITLTVSDFSADAESRITSVIFDAGTIHGSTLPPTASLVTHTAPIDQNNDPERPWSSVAVNESRSFIICATPTQIYAMDLSYGFAGENIEAFVERTRLHLAPTKDTEMLAAVYLDRFGGTTPLNVDIAVTDNASVDADLTDMSNITRYTQEVDNYKTDTRKTGRLLNTRIGNTSTDNFIIEGLSLEIGKRGTR